MEINEREKERYRENQLKFNRFCEKINKIDKLIPKVIKRKERTHTLSIPEIKIVDIKISNKQLNLTPKGTRKRRTNKTQT